MIGHVSRTTDRNQTAEFRKMNENGNTEKQDKTSCLIRRELKETANLRSIIRRHFFIYDNNYPYD